MIQSSPKDLAAACSTRCGVFPRAAVPLSITDLTTDAVGAVGFDSNTGSRLEIGPHADSDGETGLVADSAIAGSGAQNRRMEFEIVEG